jgi:hypothetical protein
MTTGIHVFTGRGGITPKRAKQLTAHGVAGVVLCAEAVDGWLATVDQAERWGDACASAGLAAGVYTFPGRTRTASPLEVTGQAIMTARACGARVVMADVEAPFHGLPERLTEFLDALTFSCTDEPLEVAVTTLGLPLSPGRFPWSALVHWLKAHPDVMLAWQCYERASRSPDDSRGTAAGLSTLRAAFGPRVVPCVASYPRRTATREGVDGAARLRADLERTGSRSVYVWSAASLDDAELDMLAAWAKGEA